MADYIDVNGIRFELTVDNKTDKSFSSATNELEAFKKAVDGIKPSSAKKVQETIKNLTPIDNVDQKQGKLNKLVEGLKNLKLGGIVDKVKGGLGKIGNTFKSVSGKIEPISKSNIAKVLTKPFRNLFGSIKDGVKGFGQLFSAIKRIAMYRLIRSALKMITQSMKEGIQNAYQYASIVGDRLATSMNMLSTSALYIKNSLGAMAAPLINMLAPVVDALTDKFVNLLNAINQVFASIGGQTTWLKAKKYPVDYMDSVGGAAKKNTKALKLWLASFDELNIIPNQKDNGSGSGNASSLDYSNMFTTEKLTDNIWGDLISKGNWEGLGQELGDRINKAISSIDTSKFGSSIGKIGNAISTTLYNTVKRIKFRQVGEVIGSGVNNVIGEINWRNLGGLFTNLTTSVFDGIIGAIETINWLSVGQAIFDFIDGAFDDAIKWLKSYDWSQLGTDIWKALKDLFEGLDMLTLGAKFMTLLGEGIKGSIGFATGFFGGIVEDLKMYLGNEFDEYKDEYSSVGSAIGHMILDGIKSVFTSLYNWAVEYVINPIITVLGKDPLPLIDAGSGMMKKIKKGFESESDDFIKNNKLHTNLQKKLNDDGNFDVSIKGKINSFQDDIPNNKRTLSMFAVKLDKAKDLIPSPDRELKSYKADITSWKDSLTNRTIKDGIIELTKYTKSFKNIVVEGTLNIDKVQGKGYGVIDPHAKLTYASGGYPQVGQIFIAREAGPEMVGTIGGRNAVANNNDIVAGIEQGVARAMMSTANSSGNINMNLYLDGEQILNSVVEHNNRAVVRTGQSPLLV